MSMGGGEAAFRAHRSAERPKGAEQERPKGFRRNGGEDRGAPRLPPREIVLYYHRLLVVMAKKWPRSGTYARGRYIKGNVDEELQLGTLSARTAVSVLFDESVIERTLVSSLVATYSIDAFTQGTDDGPIMVGVAHSDYTSSEIEEWIENTGSWNEGDLVQMREVGKRLIRKVGIFRNPDAATGSEVLNFGRPIKTRLKWLLTTGQTLRLWAYNLGNGNLATTDPNIHCEGHVNLWPR